MNIKVSPFPKPKLIDATQLSIGEMLVVSDKDCPSHEGEVAFKTWNSLVSLSHPNHIWSSDTKLEGYRVVLKGVIHFKYVV